MEARFLKIMISTFTLGLALSGCSKGGDEPIDTTAKRELLSSMALLSAKQSCIPQQILDEEDIPKLIRDGYVLSPNNQYCLGGGTSGGSPDDPPMNCIPEEYIDMNDIEYLEGQGYTPNENGEYCLGGGGNTGGGSTNGGDSAGTTSGGETSGSTSGGDTNGGSTVGGSDNGGTDGGGSTTDGSNTGGATNDGGTTGSTVGGSDNGGSVDGGSVNGSTSAGDNNGGSTNSGGSDNGGSTVGGSDNGGSANGGDTNGGTSGGATNGGANNGGTCEPDPEEPQCEMNIVSEVDEMLFNKCKKWEVPLDRMCSKMRTGNGKYTIQKRKQLVLQIVKKVKIENEVQECTKSLLGGTKCKKKIVVSYEYRPICESRDTAKILSDVMSKRKVDFSQCDISGHDKKDLFVSLFSPVEPSDLPISKQDYTDVRFFEANGPARGQEVLSFVLYGSRDNRYAKASEKLVIIVDNNPDGNSKDPKHCDQKASPLIVHVNPNHDVPRYVELTSIDDGISFDILGLNSEPVPYAPKQISWLNSSQYMFLVKPNKKGMVVGVDQMFGDNTYGPDKDFAPNGFIALAKYDGMTVDVKQRVMDADGIINAKDPIYHELRLWHDKNLDGVGTPNELYTLAQMKVKAIDLEYDASFYERDAYGNETVYKSVIQYQDGSLDLIFDLWFNYKEPK